MPIHVDLNHVIESGMITYRGLPAPVICDFLSREASRKVYASGTEFHIGRIDMIANTGTYLDSPFHRFPEGKDLSELPLSSLAGLEGIKVTIPAGIRAITSEYFSGLELGGKAVLVQTEWNQHWRTDAYFEGHPFLTADAAAFLADAGVALVGIDSYNIDDTSGGHRPVHTTLLGREIPIVEHMTMLDRLPDTGFLFTAVPPKVRAFGTFPVRAFATLASDLPPNLGWSFATMNDLAEIHRLAVQCVTRMREQGIEQWDEVYPNEETFTRDIQASTLHVLREGKDLIGCFTLDQRDDPLWKNMTWTPGAAPVAALHRLMVHPSRQGRGLSRKLMAYAENLARARGFKAIHLDCFTANPAALRLYEGRDYRRTGTAEMRKGPFICFEKLL